MAEGRDNSSGEHWRALECYFIVLATLLLQFITKQCVWILRPHKELVNILHKYRIKFHHQNYTKTSSLPSLTKERFSCPTIKRVCPKVPSWFPIQQIRCSCDTAKSSHILVYQCTSPSMPYRSHLLLTLDHVFITPTGPSLEKLKKLSTKTTPTMPHKSSSKPCFKNLKNLSTEVLQRYHTIAPSSPHYRNSNSSPQKLLQQCLRNVPPSQTQETLRKIHSNNTL